MTNGRDSAVKALLSTVGGILLTAAVTAFIQDGKDSVPVIVSGICGAVLLFATILWPRVETIINPRLVTSIGNVASDFRVWLGLLLLVWLYTSVMSIVLLIQRNELATVIEKDIIPFRLALERWVIPRHLTAEQIESIGHYLSKFSPHAVMFNIIRDDEEAGSYRADIQRALARGGWTVFQFNYVSEQREGLTTQYTQTVVSAQRPDDPRQPKPDRLFQDAFRQAGVQIDGGGGSSGASVTQDMFSINIGKRRRDSHGSIQQWPFK